MRRQNFVFEGLAEIEARIRRLVADIGYLTVSDRTGGKREEPLGRFNFTARDALPYLEQGNEKQPSTEEEEDQEWIDEGDAAEAEVFNEESDDAPAPENDSVDLAALAEAGCRWLRDIAKRNTVGEPYRRFRVRLYTPKGAHTLETASYLCKNLDYDLDLPIVSEEPGGSEPRIPTPSFDDVASHGVAQGFKALGDFYAQWGQLTLGSFAQMQGINNAMLARLHRQLQDSRNQVDQLVAAILENRVAEMKIADDRRASERSDDNRTELAKHALAQIGDMAKVLLAARGIPDELADVIGALGQSPSLMSALAEPDVKALVAEPQNLELLASMLRQAAQQSRMLREATQNRSN